MVNGSTMSNINVKTYSFFESVVGLFAVFLVVPGDGAAVLSHVENKRSFVEPPETVFAVTTRPEPHGLGPTFHRRKLEELRGKIAPLGQ